MNEALRPTIVAVAGLSNALDVWQSITEPYLDLLGDYYTAESDKLVSNLEDEGVAGKYVQWALQSAESEKERATVCLSAEVAAKAVKAVRTCVYADVVPYGECFTPLPDGTPKC